MVFCTEAGDPRRIGEARHICLGGSKNYYRIHLLDSMEPRGSSARSGGYCTVLQLSRSRVPAWNHAGGPNNFLLFWKDLPPRIDLLQ